MPLHIAEPASNFDGCSGSVDIALELAQDLLPMSFIPSCYYEPLGCWLFLPANALNELTCLFIMKEVLKVVQRCCWIGVAQTHLSGSACQAGIQMG